MINVLVTGASGFIGLSVVNSLINKGCFVRAACRIEPHFDNDWHHYEWRYYDLLEKNINYTELLNDIDVVIHLAAQVHVLNSVSKETLDGYNYVNAKGTENLACAAANNNVRKFIFMSTIKVCGESSIDLQFNSSCDVNPNDPYAISKLNAENSIIKRCADTDMSYVIIRTPLVYGPRVGANFLRLMSLVSRDYPLPFKSVDNKRSLIYVDNLADIVACCMKNENAQNKIYLVKDAELSTPELIRAIAMAFRKRVRMFSVPTKILKGFAYICGMRNQMCRLTDSLILDDNPVRKDLSWVPVYSLEEALKKTVDWYQSNN